MSHRPQEEKKERVQRTPAVSLMIGFIWGAVTGYKMTRNALDSGVAPTFPILLTILAAPGVIVIGPQNVSPTSLGFLAGFGIGTLYAGATMTPQPWLPDPKESPGSAPKL